MRSWPGHNPDVGFLHCGNRSLSMNISTHTGFGNDVDVDLLRRALDELARRAPLLVSRLRIISRFMPGPHNRWVLDAASDERTIPLERIELPAGSGPARTAEICAAGANRAIDARSEPPLEFTLVHRPGGPADLVATMHHALCDGASIGFFFYLVKRLYVAARAGRELAREPLPAIVSPTDGRFVRDQLSLPTGLRGRLGGLGLTVTGWRQLLRESRLPEARSPERDDTPVRSLHRTVFLDLGGGELAGLSRLMAAREGTVNEVMQTVVARAFFVWAEQRELVDGVLPMATTFNLRRPSSTTYSLGNFETALSLSLRREQVGDPLNLLEQLAHRSQRLRTSRLPHAHFLALSWLSQAPTRHLPRVVGKVARCAFLLYSYLGTDFAHRYLGHYGGAGEPELVRLVREYPGSGAGYVTSAPPLGLVATIKRVRRTVAVNLSLNDRLTDNAGIDELALSVRDEAVQLARLGN